MPVPLMTALVSIFAGSLAQIRFTLVFGESRSGKLSLSANERESPEAVHMVESKSQHSYSSWMSNRPVGVLTGLQFSECDPEAVI